MDTKFWKDSKTKCRYVKHNTLFENHRKSLNQHSSKASFVYIFLIKNVHFGKFWQPEKCGQTVLPNMSISNRTEIGGKCQKWKGDILHKVH